MLIGITQRIDFNKYNEQIESLETSWGRLLSSLNLTMLSLSYTINYMDHMSKFKGIILSGGNDLNDLNPSLNSKIRDEHEIKLIELSLQQKIPILCICRGAELIAHIMGGAKFIKSSEHTKPHTITSTSKEIKEKLMVNSFHSFCIADINPLFNILFKAEDETIEAFRLENLNVTALMWHPEREYIKDNGATEEEQDNSLSIASKYMIQLFLNDINNNKI